MRLDAERSVRSSLPPGLDFSGGGNVKWRERAVADERAPWKNGSADLQDRRPLDAIQLGKLDIEILGAAGERHRLIYTVTTGRTVSVAGV